MHPSGTILTADHFSLLLVVTFTLFKFPGRPTFGQLTPSLSLNPLLIGKNVCLDAGCTSVSAPNTAHGWMDDRLREPSANVSLVSLETQLSTAQQLCPHERIHLVVHRVNGDHGWREASPLVVEAPFWRTRSGSTKRKALRSSCRLTTLRAYAKICCICCEKSEELSWPRLRRLE